MFALTAVLGAAAACGGGHGDTDPVDALGDAGADVPDGASAEDSLTCPVDPDLAIPVARRCSTTADCVIAYHELNCCGSQVAVGLARSGIDAFSEAEQACHNLEPDCACDSGPTMADDGHSRDEGEIRVRCEDQQTCRTYVELR